MATLYEDPASYPLQVEWQEEGFALCHSQSSVPAMEASSLGPFIPFLDFPGGPVAKTHAPKAGGLDSVPSQGTRSYMLQLRPGAAK